MSNDMTMLQPAAALMCWTFVIWFRLYFVRLRTMRQKRIHPQKMATRQARNALVISDRELQTSDNFQNLFELPVIFYAACLMAYLLQDVSDLSLMLAWSFVGMRIVHSVIHVTYNRVTHRSFAYLIGGLLLLALVLRLATQVFA